MSHKTLQANGIELAYEEFGDSGQPVVLLIMGLGTQMIAWPEPFCQALAEHGLRVIRFDNRDVGLSTKMDSAPVPNVLKLALFSRLNLNIQVPYTLHTMTEDAVALMDVLDIEAAHVVGASMGGMIAQLMAAHYPYRVRSLTSIMSTTGRRSLPQADSRVVRHMARRPRKASPEALLEYSMRTWRLIGSPDYQPTDEELREKILAGYQRSYYPAGYTRHMAAIMAGGDRVEDLARVMAPTLVIHGKQDPLVPVEGGIDTANLIDGAKLELIEGMGHDLPKELLPTFVELISSHIETGM